MLSKMEALALADAADTAVNEERSSVSFHCDAREVIMLVNGESISLLGLSIRFEQLLV